jgi:antitoxin YefM
MLAKQTNYTNLRQNLASILDESIADRSVIIVTRQGKEDVAILAADELSNILETLHLFRSPANAQKLLAAMERADAIADKPQVKSESLAELCQELDIDEGPRES